MSLIKVVENVGNKKNYGVEFSKTSNDFTIARILKKDDVEGFVNMQDGSNKSLLEIDKKLFYFEPLFPISNEGLGMIISGEQGTGKSTLATMFNLQYEQMYPNNRLFFVSQKSKNVDRNLSKIKKLHQLTDDDINNFKLVNYKNSLILFDDSDFGDNVKAVMKMINLVSTVGREYNISWIFITHYNSRLNQTKAYTEYKVYITFQDNIPNNRMLMVHMGLNRTDIENLIALQSPFYIFNKMYNVLITDKRIMKLTHVREKPKEKKIKEKKSKESADYIDNEAYRRGILKKLRK